MSDSSTDIDALCSALGDPHRRVALRRLADSPGGMDERELARAVATELERPVKEVRVALKHAHLPILSETDAVEYCEDAVALTERADRLLDCLQSIEATLAADS